MDQAKVTGSPTPDWDQMSCEMPEVRRGLSLPSVLITGAVDSKTAKAAERLGTMTVIVKSINSDELLSFVEAAVG